MEPRPLKTTSRNCIEKEGNEVKEDNSKEDEREEEREGRKEVGASGGFASTRGIYDVIS